MGIIFTGAGIPLAITTKNYGLFGIGFVFLITGLVNKDKWKKSKNFKKMSKKQNLIFWIILILGILVGITFYYFFR